MAARTTGSAAAAQADDPGAHTAVAADSAASALDSVGARRAVPTVAAGTTGTENRQQTGVATAATIAACAVSVRCRWHLM